MCVFEGFVCRSLFLLFALKFSAAAISAVRLRYQTICFKVYNKQYHFTTLSCALAKVPYRLVHKHRCQKFH